MTIGIYKLNFIGLEKEYIGQSINIENRLADHNTKLRCNKHTFKMQEAYKLYGLPVLTILKICTIDELDILEKEYIIKLNTVDNGLNSIGYSPGKCNLYGESSGTSKYTKEDYIKVFKLLIQEYRHKYIMKETLVSLSIIKDISQGNSHTWLKEEFPVEYEKLLALVGNRNSHRSAKELGIIYPPIISPLGVIYNIDNVSKFAKEHNLEKSNLNRLLNNKQKIHKGWVVYNGNR